MNVKRLAAIIAIYCVTAIAWLILSGATWYRTDNSYSRLEGGNGGELDAGRATVQQLWGNPQVQRAPEVWTTHAEKVAKINAKGKRFVEEVQKKDDVALTRSRVNANIELDPRRKGLLWYSTYRVKYAGNYGFRNEFPNERKFSIKFLFPGAQAAYDNVVVLVNGKRSYPSGGLSQGMVVPVTLKSGQNAVLDISYGSQGLDTWHYQFGQDGAVSSVRDFDATILTNTSQIDFPENCLSPTHKDYKSGGWALRWRYGDLISGSNIGVSMPHKLNPGPFAARLSLFAPVSLLFFFAVLLIVGTVKGIKLHPIHYMFLAATFFSFHLLFSYMVDHVAPFHAFLVASAVSLALTISYLRLVVGWKSAIAHGGLWQFVFLVLFTYAFFFEGYTGLTITVGAILTLAVLMQLTGRVNWEEMLAAPRNGTTHTDS